MDKPIELQLTTQELQSITRVEVEKYVALSYTSTLYAVMDDKQGHYAVITVPHLPRSFPSRVVVMAQVVDDKVLILEDTTDKPLVDALMINGNIPREQIVLVYAGEPTPEKAT